MEFCEIGEEGSCSTDCQVTFTANDHIANALNAVKSGGQTTTQNFELTPNQVIKSSQFENFGFDSHSIIFAVENKLFDNGKITVENEGDYGSDGFSYISYTGAFNLPVKAIVICEQTGNSLDETINISSELIQDAENIDTAQDMCGNDEYQPCCVVIIENR